MIYEALMAYFHYFSILGLVVAVFMERVLFKKKLTINEAKRLQKIDSFYGLASILVLATGLIRSIYFGKGTDYYWTNTIFLTKLGLFIIVGILSIWPTVLFLKWRKSIKNNDEYIEVALDKVIQTKKIITLELIILFIIPLFASLMSRGFSF